MSDIDILVWCIGAFFAFFAFGLWAAWSEAKQWNRGVCRENGLRWVHFDTDSQGGRGYRAGDCYCWISWPVDRKRYFI